MIIQCDFDGTITRNNLSVLLRENFAHSGWRKIDSDYLCGRLTVEQSNRQQYALIKEPKEKLQQFVRQHIEVRPAFRQFVKQCLASGIRFTIVSSGLDFYIEIVLKDIGIPEVELYCAQTYFGQDGITVTYQDPEGNIIEKGFKKNYLTWLRKQNKPIIYIGDGLSDFEAASAADYVFATDQLHRLLTASSTSHYIFSDFSDIWHQICQFENWKASQTGEKGEPEL